MNADRFRAILAELIDENPFAIRAVLRILGVEFTAGVPTLAVTCEERPRLLVNLDFVGEHCRTDAEVKALLCHEFLHVLLRHTEERKPLHPRAAPGARRRDQRDHPSRARERVLGDDEPLLRRRAGALPSCCGR